MVVITAYVGRKPALPVLLDGLLRLAYVPFDSSGVGLVHPTSGIHVYKCQTTDTGLFTEDAKDALTKHKDATVGLSHLRRASEGEPSDLNAHPHVSTDNSICVVHNGRMTKDSKHALRQSLISRGINITSRCDTELFVKLIEDIFNKNKDQSIMLHEAVRLALLQLDGSFGIIVASTHHPHTLVTASIGSPIILGRADDGFFIASDAVSFVEYTPDVILLEEGEMAVVHYSEKEASSRIFNIYANTEVKNRNWTKLRWTHSQLEKRGYVDHMEKDIFSQGVALRSCMHGRIQGTNISLGGLEKRGVMEKIAAARRIIMCANGSAYFAALVGEYIIEEISRTPVVVKMSTEFAHEQCVVDPEKDVLIAVSQSGEDDDTVECVRTANKQGLLTIGITNIMGCALARATTAGVYLHAGPELGKASTKTFTSQVAVLIMLAISLGERRKVLAHYEVAEKTRKLRNIPQMVETVLANIKDKMKDIARKYRLASNYLFLGRGANYPVALEGAMRMKSLGQSHAEGYPSAEMKHGPIALMEPCLPVFVIAPRMDPVYEKVNANIKEIIARHASVIAITGENNHDLDSMCDEVIRVPEVDPFLAPLIVALPFQLLCYYVAKYKKLDPDLPMKKFIEVRSPSMSRQNSSLCFP